MFIFNSIHQTSFPVCADEKHPQNMMLPPPCITVERMFSAWWEVVDLCQTWFCLWWLKSNILVLSDPNNFFQMLERSLRLRSHCRQIWTKFNCICIKWDPCLILYESLKMKNLSLYTKLDPVIFKSCVAFLLIFTSLR